VANRIRCYVCQDTSEVPVRDPQGGYLREAETGAYVSEPCPRCGKPDSYYEALARGENPEALHAVD
jgi:hypothetical protein